MADDPVADLTVGAPGAAEVDTDLETPDSFGDELAPEVGGVDPATVRAVLEGVTGAVHHVAGHPEVPDHWKATDDELDRAAAALARIASRSPVMAKALGGDAGDGLALVMVGGQYVIRNVAAARAAAPDDEDGTDDHGQREADPGGDHRDGGATGVDRAGVPATLRLGGGPDGAAAG